MLISSPNKVHFFTSSEGTGYQHVKLITSYTNDKLWSFVKVISYRHLPVTLLLLACHTLHFKKKKSKIQPELVGWLMGVKDLAAQA